LHSCLEKVGGLKEYGREDTGAQAGEEVNCKIYQKLSQTVCGAAGLGKS
jgi:hypothetical protein